MGKHISAPISRREFLRRSAGGLAGLSAASLVPVLTLGGKQATAGVISPPSLAVESNPMVKVLRWRAFVQGDEDAWLSNTRRWEKLTGGRVVTDFVPFNDVRPRAAMEATLGTGHDLVLGWFDDPHLYPDKLIDLTALADYLAEKYGGWYPVCETYGRDPRTQRWIALPMGCAGMCINYRKSWVREAGFETVPGRIEGFLKCCRALKAGGHPTGFALGNAVGDRNSWTHWWLWSFGGKAVEADGRTIAINSKETTLALETARELYDTMVPGVLNWRDPDNNKAFLAGKISATNNGASILYAAKHHYPHIDADLATMNFPTGPVGRPSELSLISPAFIFKHALMPNAARHYLLFMFEAEQYGNWINDSLGYVTQSLKGFRDLPVWAADSRLAPYRECLNKMLPNGYAGPLGTASAAAMSDCIIPNMIVDVCLQRRTPKTAALHAEKRLARLYG
jgi:multiple sugar transport system substrate-binding protein